MSDMNQILKFIKGINKICEDLISFRKKADDIYDREVEDVKSEAKHLISEMRKSFQKYCDVNFTKLVKQFTDIEQVLIQDYQDVFEKVRNNVMHLAVIDKFLSLLDKYNSKNSSYFSLYNFVLQSLVCDVVEELSYCKKNFLSKGNYSKDVIQVLNMPFAYNLARFKALTNEKIFDKVQKFGN